MQYAAKSAACLVLASLALSDMRSRHLPTRAVLLVACLYGVDAEGVSLFSLAAHVATAMIAFLAFALLFRFGWMGGGDVKLAAAVFLWTGPAYAWPVFFIVSCCGLFLGIAALAIHSYRHRKTADSPQSTQHVVQHGVPYGVALAVGGIAAIWLPVLNRL
ncbi:A24 family peptidase [Paraburkholderia piptadeniae]|nr:prepilin peptidase [Paraburkholderia piptadeniae]